MWKRPQQFKTSKKQLIKDVTLFHETKNILEAAKVLVWLLEHDVEVEDLINQREVEYSQRFENAILDEGKRYSLLADLVSL